MRNWLLGAALLAVVGAPIAAEARRLGAYDYPFVSPLVATVAATPPANQAALPSEAEIRAVGRTRYVKVFPDRPVPEIYWFLDRGLPYLIYPQPDPRAPLFFLIGGTGAGHDSSKSLVMVRVLYQAGFQVVSLPSPTHPSFIVAASRASVPGMLEEDAADLYHVMDLVDRQLQVELAPSAYYVGGYSLGGAEAAFVHRLDARERRFRFAKALLVNPPVSLYSSLTILDDMLDRYLREDPAAVNGLLPADFSIADGAAILWLVAVWVVYGRFADRYEGVRVDILVLNAGIGGTKGRQQSVDGHELIMATNYLGHFALTARLLESLRRASRARVVTLGSLVAKRGHLDPRDLDLQRRWSSGRAYANSKLAMVMFARELQRHSTAGDWGLNAHAAQPGWAATGLYPPSALHSIGTFLGRATGLVQSASDGAQPVVFCAASRQAAAGGYYGPIGPFGTAGPVGRTPLPRHARQPKALTALWEATEELVGVPFELPEPPADGD